VKQARTATPNNIVTHARDLKVEEEIGGREEMAKDRPLPAARKAAKSRRAVARRRDPPLRLLMRVMRCLLKLNAITGAQAFIRPYSAFEEPTTK